MKMRVFLICLVFLAFFIASASAEEYAIDVKIGKPIYSSGENMTYQVILLQGGVPYSGSAEVIISDYASEKIFRFNVESNKDSHFKIDKEFQSGYWKIVATYGDNSVTRFFSIGEREEAEFSINGDRLIIQNSGNVPYTKEVSILIGDKLIPQKMYIEIGDYKEIKLVAPDGNYDIQVSDGVRTISKQNVYLTGTGRVVGALDEQLVDSQSVLGGARDVKSDSFFNNSNFSLAFIFIAAVFGLFILILIEKGIRKKRASSAKDIVGMHWSNN